MSPLLPQTIAFLYLCKKQEPIFSNSGQAEEFESLYKKGPYRVLPRTDGKYAIIDDRRDFAQKTINVVNSDLEAMAELVRL